MSLDLGMDAMTQTDKIAPSAKQSADCTRSGDKSPSERTYSERLDSLSTELSEIYVYANCLNVYAVDEGTTHYKQVSLYKYYSYTQATPKKLCNTWY
jgi:hypothetical protein